MKSRWRDGAEELISWGGGTLGTGWVEGSDAEKPEGLRRGHTCKTRGWRGATKHKGGHDKLLTASCSRTRCVSTRAFFTAQTSTQDVAQGPFVSFASYLMGKNSKAGLWSSLSDHSGFSPPVPWGFPLTLIASPTLTGPTCILLSLPSSVFSL